MLANSGAEALENAVKIARHATGREAVVVFEHAFHGRTLMTLLDDQQGPALQVRLRPLRPRGLPPALSPTSTAGTTPGGPRPPRQLDEFFRTQVAAEKVACVVLELVLGEGGFIVAPRTTWTRSRASAASTASCSSIDEVQTGFGRTGRMFACEHYGLAPDLIAMAKSLGGGLPISAVTGRAEVMDSAQVGGLGGTYVGNPVSCAAALAAVDVHREEPALGARRGDREDRRAALPRLPRALPLRGRRAGPRRDARARAGRGPGVQGARQGAHGPRPPRRLRARPAPRHAPAPTATSSAPSCRSSSPTAS